ncbi:hypothetical protein [Flavobacterium sp. 3HN19-14]|uniref:hypothetical protein n=1 Tax=Flavobacterium sp. 3HN19-14 TaxID=3448133 RepID=UPI003EE22286
MKKLQPIKWVCVLICTLLLSSGKVRAQQLFLLISDGDVKLNAAEKLEKAVLYPLVANSIVLFGQNSHSLVLNAVTQKFAEISPKAATKLTTADLLKKLAVAVQPKKVMTTSLKKPSSTTPTTNIFDYIMRYHQVYRNNTIHPAKVHGAIKGLENEDRSNSTVAETDKSFPADSATVLSKSIRLQWNPESAGY